MAHVEHRRTVLKVVLVTQLVLALVTALTVVLVYRSLNGDLATMPGMPEENRPRKERAEGPKEPLNILVMGTDDRSCEGCGIDQEAGGGGSDTTVLLHVSADRKEAYGVSLPRDAIVDRPDCRTADGKTVPGEDAVMFNTAFGVGGPMCTIQMIEALTDIYIDHAVTVDFNGFVDMVDAVGGVEVCLPREVDDPEHGIFLDAGTQVLEGRQALNYVRERTQLSLTGDVGRMKRQQAFIASMINKVMSAGTLTRPDKVVGFLRAATRSVVLSESLGSLSKVVDLALEFRDTGLSDIRFITVPIEAYPPDPLNRLQWTGEAEGLWRRIAADRPLGKAYDDGSISAADPIGGQSDPSEPGGSSGPGGPGPGAGPGEEERAAAAEAAGLCA